MLPNVVCFLWLIPCVWAAQSPDTVKMKFTSLLVEDTLRGGKSYVDFLCAVHTQIQNRLLDG